MRFFSLLKIIGIIFFLTGCATSNIQSTKISANTDLPLGHGVVAVQVVNNTDRLAPFHKGWTEIIVIRTDNIDELKRIATEKAKATGKSIDPDKLDWQPYAFSLTPNDKGVIDSQIFVGSMPEGTYLISSLYSFYSDGDISSWITMPVYQAAGYFDVESNKMTNLGSVVFQPLLNVKEKTFWNNRSSQKAYVTRLNDKQDFTNFILSLYPNLAQKIEFIDPKGWSEDGFDEFRTKLSQLSRENAFGERVSYLEKSGKGAVAARFGQLKVLQKNGEWMKSDLPTNGQLSAVIELENKVAVGSERGLVFINNDSSDDWTEIQPVSAKEAVVWFGKSKNKHYALTSAAMDYYVYEFEALTEPWNKIGNFKKKERNNWLIQNGGLFPWIKQDGSLRVINDNKVYDYEIASNTWLSAKTNSLVKLAKLRHGALVGLEVSQWDGVGDQVYSLDDGESWLEINRSLSLFGDVKSDSSLPTLLADNTVVTVARVKEKGAKSRGLKIVSSSIDNLKAKGKWQVHGSTQDTCYTLLPELTDQNTLFFLCDKGEIISTDDFGGTWQTELNIDLNGMQKKYQSMIKAMSEEDGKIKEPTD
jgi:hypothetical protein